MSYLDCAQYDCCHNKAGCCCLNDIKVHHTGESDAVCSSYRNKITANCAKRLPLWNGEAFLCAFSCETPHFVV